MPDYVMIEGDDGRAQMAIRYERAFQKRYPNFQSYGRWFLVRCFTCGGEGGKENWAMAVASGQCAWCGDTIDD